MSELQFDVDAAQTEYEQARADGDIPPAPDRALDPALDAAAIDVKELEGDDIPPGFKSYEDYVAEGGDPDMFRGRKAYAAEHGRISENKAMRKEIKGLRGTVQQTMEAVSDWQTQEREKHKRELEGALNTAKENEDVEGAIDAQRQIDNLPGKRAPAVISESQVIQDYRLDNPMLDADSDEFNADFNAAVEGYYNSTYNLLSNNGRNKMSNTQLTLILDKSMREARDLHRINEPGNRGDDDDDNAPPESPRNQRGGQKRPRRGGGQPRQLKTPGAEDFKIDKPRNGRDTTGASVRDMIHEKALQQGLKSGKNEADAKAYADGETQRFEASLNR